MAILKAIQSTILKQSPTQQAQALPPTATYSLPAGKTLEITTSSPAANKHIQVKLPKPLQGSITWYAFAEHVKVIKVPPAELEAARDREKVYQTYLNREIQEGSNQMHLSFLDQGVENTPYASEINSFPDRLKQKPDGKTIGSLGASVTPTGSSQPVSFSAYPTVGKQPTIDAAGLNFLHADIKEACVCVGSFVNDQIQAHWLGKNALTEGQFWSSTKIVPLMNVVCQANIAAPSVKVSDCTIRDLQPQGTPNQTTLIAFMDAAIEMINYKNGADGSNGLAAMFKRFSSRPQLEKWFRDLTGNKELEFRGFYGVPPFIANPQLQSGSTTVLKAPAEGASGNNLITAYDLTRIVTMLGWHHHVSSTARLPGAQWHSLQTVVQAMGHDTARYVDAAIATLGLQPFITSPVILSKLGFGASDSRARTELIYSAFVQFVDTMPRENNKPAVLRTLALTLRGAVQKNVAPDKRDLDEEARVLDARMAAEVTEILRRVVTQELA